MKAGEREAGLLDVRAGDAARSRPSAPASSSSGRPNASGRLRSSAPTVTPGGSDDRRRLERVITLRSRRGVSSPLARRYSTLITCDVSASREDHDAVAAWLPISRAALGDRHRLDRLRATRAGRRGAAAARGPRDGVAHAVPSVGPARVGAPARLGSRRRRLARPAASLPLALHPLRLLRQSCRSPGVTDGSQAAELADAVQELLAARVQRDIGAVGAASRASGRPAPRRALSFSSRSSLASLRSTSRRSVGVMST